MRPHHHHHLSMPLCTRAHQIGALALVVITFILTRSLDRLSSFPGSNSNSNSNSSPYSSSYSNSDLFQGGALNWPRRGYGDRIDLRIYVYDESEIDGLRELMRGRDGQITPQACVKGQWGTQVKIHRLLLKSKYRTVKKDEADFFFVPSYVKCVRMMGRLNDKEINQTYVKVLSQMPYFRRSGGRDHIFIFPRKPKFLNLEFFSGLSETSQCGPDCGAGAHLFRSWATYLNRSIILTPEGDRTDKRDTSAFNTWKDIIIPGNVEDGMTKFDGAHIVHPLSLNKRKYLANFLGRAQSKTGRLQLIELAKQYPDKLESPELKFSGPNKLGRTEYFDHLKNAKFCLAPRGESSWTLRFYESFFVECVPVLLSDQVELPFQNVIDYTEISIKWPSTRISIELLDYLQSIPDERIEEMLARGREVRCLWVYSPDTAPCSAMLGILWELQRKVRQFHQSTETFWLHNRSFVNRDLMEFHSWRTPIPLP